MVSRLLAWASFFVGGVADLLWHTFFGIEATLAAEYSPPHLVLATAGLLIATGPLRAAWQSARSGRASLWSAVLSATLMLSTFTFFTGEFHPFDHPWAWARFRPLEVTNLGLSLPAFGDGGVSTQDLAQAIGAASILLQSGLLIALLLLLIRRWGAQLPLGWLTFVFTLNGAAMSLPHGDPWVVPFTIVAGIVADVLYRWLQPETQRPGQVRLFAVLTPVVLYSLYFLTLLFLGGVWWPIPLWTGAIALSGIAGLLVSYLIVPPCTSRGSRQVKSSGVNR